MRRSRARCHYRKTRAACIVTYGDVSCRDIRDHSRDEKRRYPFRALIDKFLCLTYLSRESADSGADVHSESERIDVTVLGGIESRLIDSLPCGCCRINGEFVLLSGKRRLDTVIGRIEILYLAGNLYRKIICRDRSDEIYAADTVQKVLPVCLHIISDRGYDTHSCHYYSFVHVISLIPKLKFCYEMRLAVSAITFSAPRMRSSTIALAGSILLTIPAHSPAMYVPFLSPS